jgi:2,3-bisphosphoglycerate-dependent phosphoglycerate mutase
MMKKQMKNYFLFLLLVVQMSFAQHKTTTIYFIRHAEKADSSKNPDLSSAGLERAAHWSAIFSETTFDTIYSTDFNRTKQTATPTAENKKLDITLYDAKSLDFDKFKTDNLGKTILVVGHSNTTPDFVNKLINQNVYAAIEDTTFGNLYIVTLNGDLVTHLLLKSL